MYLIILVAVDFFIEIFDFNIVKTISSLGQLYNHFLVQWITLPAVVA